MIHRMPNTASLQDIMAELYFRQKVDASLQALDNNKGIEYSVVKERLKKYYFKIIGLEPNPFWRENAHKLRGRFYH
jgi:hypothetical protein